MRQILQSLKTGETELADIPVPGSREHHVLIRTVSSLISIGTERMLIEFGKGNLISKARKQPDKVRQVLEKIRVDGLSTTITAVNSKLEQSIALGYSNVGRVVEGTGPESEFRKGERVVSNGSHAEFVSVPSNLIARVPEGVDAESAAFTVPAAIALQGIRLLNPTLGECVVVTGLGLIGLLAVQILRANGCRVIGVDVDPLKCEMARQFEAETVNLSEGGDPIEFSARMTGGKGVDGVLVTASTTSSEPIHQAATMCRKRGRIVLVGVTGLTLSRSDFYEKELSFQVSCSYGPGRYDPNYEIKGQDYPFGFVRWTEQRNFEAVLQLLASGNLNVKPLITHRYPFDDALTAYGQIDSGKALGIVLDYGDSDDREIRRSDLQQTVRLRAQSSTQPARGVVGMIGAGGFTKQVLLPALAGTGVHLKAIVSSQGVSGTQLGRKFGFDHSTTELESVLNDEDVDTLVITTRHNSHAGLVLKGLNAGKRVFVEKPLCLTPEELGQIEQTYESLGKEGKEPFLMVGFNRRFAPQIVELRRLLQPVMEPRAMTMLVNAGSIPKDHWTQDLRIGGGRIVGEGCHFIDLLRFLADSQIVRVKASACALPGSLDANDTVTIVLEFENGSTGTIQYFSNGHRAVAKERLEVYCGGRVVILNNFRRMSGYGFKGFKRMNLWRQDKGHKNEMVALIDAVREGQGSPIPFNEIVEVTRASFEATGMGNQAVPD